MPARSKCWDLRLSIRSKASFNTLSRLCVSPVVPFSAISNTFRSAAPSNSSAAITPS